MKKIEYYTKDLPAYWASYLINGDCSGMEESEIEQCDKATEGLSDCVGCSSESHFGSYNGLGCDLLTYTFIVNE